MSYNKRQVFEDNLEAIRTYYDITSKEREITKEDIEKISKYKGFGGLKVVLWIQMKLHVGTLSIFN